MNDAQLPAPPPATDEMLPMAVGSPSSADASPAGGSSPPTVAKGPKLGALAILLPLLVGLHWCLWLLQHQHGPRGPLGDELMYLAAAQRVQERGEAGLEPLWPPFYPHFLAPLLGPEGELQWIWRGQLCLLIAAALLLASLAKTLDDRPATPWLAAWGLLSFPTLAAFSYFLWPEILHACLMVAVFWIVIKRPSGMYWMPLLGLLLAVTVLTKSLLLPFVPLLFAHLLWANGLRRGLGRIALVILCLGLGIAPTLIHNHQRLGKAMIANSALFNLWVGLTDEPRQAYGDDNSWRRYKRYRRSAQSVDGRQDFVRTQVEREVEQQGLAHILAKQAGTQYFRFFDRQSYFLAQLPGGALANGTRGYGGEASLLTRGLGIASVLAYVVLLIAAPLGLAVLNLYRRDGGWLIYVCLGYQLALFFLLHANPRYRLQMLPWLILVAAAFLARAWQARQAGDRYSAWAAPWRWTVGWTLAALLLFFAFAGPWLDQRNEGNPSQALNNGVTLHHHGQSTELQRDVGRTHRPDLSPRHLPRPAG